MKLIKIEGYYINPEYVVAVIDTLGHDMFNTTILVNVAIGDRNERYLARFYSKNTINEVANMLMESK